jgi:hypothetical protein
VNFISPEEIFVQYEEIFEESEEIIVDSEEDQDNYFKKKPQPVFINHNYEA